MSELINILCMLGAGGFLFIIAAVVFCAVVFAVYQTMGFLPAVLFSLIVVVPVIREQIKTERGGA